VQTLDAPTLRPAFRADQLASGFALLTFWGCITFVVFLLTLVGQEADYLVIAAMVGVFIRNWVTDPTGIANFLLLMSAALIGAFPVRYQVGHELDVTTSPFNITLYLLVLVALARELSHARRELFRGIVLAAIVYVAIAVLAAVLSNEPLNETRSLVFAGTLPYLMFIYAFQLAARNGREAVLGRLLAVLLVCGLADASYGLLQQVIAIPEFEHTAFALTGNEDYIAYYTDFTKSVGFGGSVYGLFYNLVFFILAAPLVAPFVERDKRWLPWAAGFVSLLLLLTFIERTAVIMLALAVGAVVVARSARGSFARAVARVVVAIAVLAALLAPLQAAIQSLFSAESSKMIRMYEISDPTTAMTMLARYEKWTEALDLIPSTLLLGDGYKGRFGFHMEYLNVLVTYGIVGFACWATLLAGLMRKLWRHAFDAREPEPMRRIALALVGFDVALLAAAIPNNPFTYTSGLVFFSLAAVICAERDT
jgi:hypothetical protein